ncbi:MAG: M56 family metallopeptidase, partial [Thermoguttaceae bacterium]
LYLLGVAVGLAWWLMAVVALLRIIRAARSAPPHCRRLLIEIAGRRAARVQLLTSRRAKQPFAFAWHRATIVLPEDLCGDRQGVRLAIAHEWSHIDRRDFRAWFLAGLVRVLFFYQPLVWWLRGQLRLCQDYVADARASGQAAAPEDYAEFLVVRAAAGSLHPAMAGLGLGFTKSELYRRVVMLVQNRPLESRPPRRWTVAATCAALLLVSAVATLTISPRRAVAVAPAEAPDVQTGPASTGGGCEVPRTPGKSRSGAGAVTISNVSGKAEMVVGVRPRGNCSISGTVVSTTTGKPVARARMYLHYNVTHGSIFINAAGDGTFVFKDIPKGPFSLQVSRTPGYQDTAYNPESTPGRFPAFSLHDGEHRSGIVLKAKPAYRVSGRVFGENGKVPDHVGQLIVLAWFKADDGRTYEHEQAQVKADGSYVVDGLSGKPVYLMVANRRAETEGDGYSPIYSPSTFFRDEAKLVTFDASHRADGVDITLRKTGGLVLEGTVRDESGHPVPETFVVVHHRDMLFDRVSAYTDARGHYAVRGLGDGEVLVHVDAVHRGFVKTRVSVNLDKKTAKMQRNFTLHRGVSISGTLVDQDGKPWRIGSSFGFARTTGGSQGPAPTLGWSGLPNKYSIPNISDGSAVFFIPGEGDYDSSHMMFPTKTTFVLQGMMPGHTTLFFSPKKEDEKVIKILHDGRDIMTSGIDTKPGQEIKDVTIVIGGK